jgi:hypothetical protein
MKSWRCRTSDPEGARLAQRWAFLLLALWWGGLSLLGFLVVPMLFAHLPTPAMAGAMAGRLFSAQTWVSTGSGILLFFLVLKENQHLPSENRSYTAMYLIVISVLMALLVEFGIAPRIVARENLKLWHTAGSVLYGLQWLCVGLLAWRLTRQQVRC